MQAVVRGHLVHYNRVGTGAVLVVLHGWGDDSRSWASLAKKLATRYEVITIDLPGFGKSQPPKETWGLDDYANVVGELLSKIQVKPQAIIGHSNGGAVAIRGLANGSLSAEKLILLASAGIRGEYKGRLKVLRYAAKTAKLATTPLPKSVKNQLRRKAYKSIGSDMLVAEHLQETFKKVVTDDVREDAARLTLSTLIVYGTADDQTPVRYGETYHSLIAGSELQVVPDAGHFLQIDAPDEIQRFVEEFVA